MLFYFVKMESRLFPFLTEMTLLVEILLVTLATTISEITTALLKSDNDVNIYNTQLICCSSQGVAHAM